MSFNADRTDIKVNFAENVIPDARHLVAQLDASHREEFTSKTLMAGELILEYRKIREMLAIQQLMLQRHKNLPEAPALEECADAIFIMKKTADMLDALRKEWNDRCAFLTRLFVMRFVQDQLNEEDPATNVKGRLTTSSPRVTNAPKLPSYKGEREGEVNEDFVTFCVQFLGIPEDKVRNGSIRPHWPTVTEMVTEALERGESIPGGLDPSKTFPDYRTTSRAASGVDLDDDDKITALMSKSYG